MGKSKKKKKPGSELKVPGGVKGPDPLNDQNDTPTPEAPTHLSPPKQEKIKEDVAVFYSKSKNYRVILIPVRNVMVDGITIVKPGHTIEFMNGVFTTNDKKVIEKLRLNKEFGQRFYEAKDKMTAEVMQRKVSIKVSEGSVDIGSARPDQDGGPIEEDGADL